MAYCRSLEEARREQPEGVVCPFCSHVNELWDDLGFFYVIDPRDGVYKATCGTRDCPKAETAER